MQNVVDILYYCISYRVPVPTFLSHATVVLQGTAAACSILHDSLHTCITDYGAPLLGFIPVPIESFEFRALQPHSMMNLSSLLSPDFVCVAVPRRFNRRFGTLLHSV
jgi:hypothetical protein